MGSSRAHRKDKKGLINKSMFKIIKLRHGFWHTLWLVYEEDKLRGVLGSKHQAKRFLKEYQEGKFIIVNPIYSNDGPNIPLKDIDDPKRDWSYWEDSQNKIIRIKE